MPKCTLKTRIGSAYICLEEYYLGQYKKYKKQLRVLFVQCHQGHNMLIHWV